MVGAVRALRETGTQVILTGDEQRLRYEKRITRVDPGHIDRTRGFGQCLLCIVGVDLVAPFLKLLRDQLARLVDSALFEGIESADQEQADG